MESCLFCNQDRRKADTAHAIVEICNDMLRQRAYLRGSF